MTLSEIRDRHESLERIKATHSAAQILERKSQANKDRGWLLAALSEAKSENRDLRRELQALRGRLEVLVSQLESA